MRIQVEETPDTLLIRVDGEIDMQNSPKLRENLIQLVKKEKETLVISLEGVSYIDSSGLATLIEAFQKTVVYGGTFKLVIGSPRILDVFKLAKLHKVFDIFDTIQTAGIKKA